MAGAWKWWVCSLLLLATTLNYMDRLALNQTSVRVTTYFQLDNAAYGMVEGAFSLAFACGALFFGFLVDRFKIRYVYPAVVVGWSLAGFGTGFADSFAMLLLFRILLGFFESANWPCGVLTVKRLLPPEARPMGNALFGSGTAIGAIITPLVVLAAFAYADPHAHEQAALQLAGSGLTLPPDSPSATAWQLPFRLIGVLGIFWVVAWTVVVRPRHDAALAAPATAAGEGGFFNVFRDRRYWILLLMILSVNLPWHSFRVWLPKYLQQGQGYSEQTMMFFTTAFYFVADLGSITTGLMTFRLIAWGWSIREARQLLFLVMALLTTLGLSVLVVPTGNVLLVLLLLVAFGSLGLFPLYFAFSQEISVRHQGKITGSLGALNYVILSGVFPLQGYLIDVTKSYALGMSVAGVMPLVCWGVVWLFWPRDEVVTP